jgi:hypothetical protein
MPMEIRFLVLLGFKESCFNLIGTNHDRNGKQIRMPVLLGVPSNLLFVRGHCTLDRATLGEE